jgi:chorismate synthase
LVRAAMKPLSTLKKPLSSISLKEKKETEAHFERSDVCAVPSAAVIGESLLCLVLMEEVLKKFGGDTMAEIKKRYKEWLDLEKSKFT